MSRAPVWALRTAFRTVGTVAPDVAARWAETIFCTPPRHVPPLADEEFVATGTRFMVRSEGQDIAAWEWGVGSTVLLVHGWGSRAGRFRVLATALLESGFRVVAHDAPAHGRSTGRFASLPEFARALRAVADRAGEIHGIVGHSLGGSAACLAMREGLPARRLVLVAPPSDVLEFSRVFGDHLRIPPPARLAMRRNLEERLRMRWEDLNIAAIARESFDPGARHPRPRRRGGLVRARRGDRPRLSPRAVGRDQWARPPRDPPRPGRREADRRVPARGGRVIVMDRENLLVPGWSHVLSTTNDLAELTRFGKRWGRRDRRFTWGGSGRISISSTSLATARSRIPACVSSRARRRCCDSSNHFDRASTASGYLESNPPSNRRERGD